MTDKNKNEHNMKAIIIMAIVALACYVMVDKDTAKVLWDKVKNNVKDWVS